MKLLKATIAAVSTLTLVSCSPSAPTSAPTGMPAPTPTFACTPESGGTPVPCNQRQFDDMLAKDALYAEAEQVERQFIAHFNTAQRRPGTDVFPPSLETYVAGPAREGLVGLFTRQRDKGYRVVGDLTKIVFIHRNPGDSIDGSEVSLAVCTDDRHVDLIVDNKVVGTGSLGLERHYYKRVDGKLKLWESRLVADPSCA